METKLQALRELLNAVGTGTDISTKERRLRVQKAVYLMQAAGIKMGYSYSWYVNGPYSTSLTRDYYDLAGDTPIELGPNRALNGQVVQLVDRVRMLHLIPEGVNLSEAHWAELLASVHYLRHEMRKDVEKARAVISIQKPHLLPHYATAEQALEQHGLL